MKRLIFLVLVLGCSGCDQPVEQAAVGDGVSAAHFVDAVTGKCILIKMNNLDGEYSASSMKLVPLKDCTRRMAEAP